MMRTLVVLCMVMAAHLSAEEQSPRPIGKTVNRIRYAVTITQSSRTTTREKQWRTYCVIMVKGVIERASTKQRWRVAYTYRSDFTERLTVTAEGNDSALEITHYVPKKRWRIEKTPYSIDVSASEISVTISQGGESYALYGKRSLAQAKKEAEKAKRILAVCRELLGIRREDLGIASIKEAFKDMDGLVGK